MNKINGVFSCFNRACRKEFVTTKNNNAILFLEVKEYGKAGWLMRPKQRSLEKIFSYIDSEGRKEAIVEWRKIILSEGINNLSEDMFNDIMAECASEINYIIVLDNDSYDRMPDIGKPGTDIKTSEGIIETWEIKPGVLMFYMPIYGALGRTISDEQALFWSKVWKDLI